MRYNLRTRFILWTRKHGFIILTTTELDKLCEAAYRNGYDHGSEPPF